MKRLPPLTAVEAFVQTARLGSVKAAAESLALSSPALSRRVQALERHVGRPLFERRHQAVQLNPDGEQLLAEIGPALEELGQAMERAAGQSELMRLKLAVLPLFASHRLMPRLGELRALHPDLHIDIDTRPHALARLDEGLDAAIALAREVDRSLYSVKLGSNRVVAVGGEARRPHARASRRARGRRPCCSTATCPTPSITGARRSACPDLEPAAVDHFDSGQLILDAAARGAGRRLHVRDASRRHAHDPRLVRLFDVAAPSPYAYWFACRRAALSRRPVQDLPRLADEGARSERL